MRGVRGVSRLNLVNGENALYDGVECTVSRGVDPTPVNRAFSLNDEFREETPTGRVIAGLLLVGEHGAIRPTPQEVNMPSPNQTTLGTTKENSKLLRWFAEQNDLPSKTKALILLVKFATTPEGLKAFRQWRASEIVKGSL